jgi:hypothetical protein
MTTATAMATITTTPETSHVPIEDCFFFNCASRRVICLLPA